jgi:hypothetical protein
MNRTHVRTTAGAPRRPARPGGVAADTAAVAIGLTAGLVLASLVTLLSGGDAVATLGLAGLLGAVGAVALVRARMAVRGRRAPAPRHARPRLRVIEGRATTAARGGEDRLAA